MRMSRKMTIYAAGKTPVELSATTTQWINRVEAGSLLNRGTVGHAGSEFYAMELSFTAPKAMTKVTLHLAGTHNNYQSGVQYRCGVASSLPSNNATSGTVFYTPASSGGTVNATATVTGTFAKGSKYTLWLWSSGNGTGGYDFINKTNITLEGV